MSRKYIDQNEDMEQMTLKEADIIQTLKEDIKNSN